MTSGRSTSSSEKRKYLYQRLISHLIEQENPERLFELLEDRDYLALQTDFWGGFQPTSRDLEKVLATTIDRQDWNRFLRYALIAFNLRGLAESLGDSEILGAMAAHGRMDLALDIVAQLSDPQHRARAYALLTAHCGQENVPRGQLLGKLVDDLNSVKLQPSSMQAWTLTLCDVARHSGPELKHHWDRWVEPLGQASSQRDQVWRAVAESWLMRRKVGSDGLWDALGRIHDSQLLLEFLPRRLADSCVRDPESVLDRIAELPHGDEALCWHAHIALLYGQSKTDPAASLKQWRSLETAAIPWSPELIKAGAGFWNQISRENLDDLIERISDPASRAALQVTALGPECDLQQVEAAGRSLEDIPIQLERLHWYLRFLRALPPRFDSRFRRGVKAVLDYLFRQRYLVPEEDLTRFLDLVVRAFPSELRRQLQNVLWSGSGRPTMLRTLVAQSNSNALLEELLLHAEEHSSTVSRSEAQGFRLRREILIGLACRLCSRRGTLGALVQAADRLLPSERDELRSKVAIELAAAGFKDLSKEAVGGIRSRRRLLRTMLLVAPDEPELDDLLVPRRLYEASATVDFIEDERSALAALWKVPLNPGLEALEHIEAIRRPARQVEALADLARHALCLQESRFQLQDKLSAILPLKQGLGGVDSDAWLLSMTPELVDLGSKLGRLQALAECQEAVVRVVSLESHSWTRREEVIETLLARVRRLLLEESREGDADFLNRCSTLATFFDWLADLPKEGHLGPGRQQLRKHWHSILPMLFASLEDCPRQVLDRLEHPWRFRICQASGLSMLLGWDRAWRFWSRAVRLLVPTRMRRRFRSQWRLGRQEGFGALWPWMEPEHGRILALCSASPRERGRRARALLSEESPGWEELAALIYLIIPDDLILVTNLLHKAALRQGHYRLTLRLIRWLPAKTCERLATALPQASGVLAARCRLGSDVPEAVDDETWIRALADLVSRGGFDANDPGTIPLRRRLWSIEQATGVRLLARATAAALAAGGRERGETALRFFLNAYLAPRLGSGAPDRLAMSRNVESAFRKALSLSGSPEPLPAQEVPSQRTLARSQRLYRRWNRTRKTSLRKGKRNSPLERPAQFGMIFGILCAMVLMPLDMVVVSPGEISRDEHNLWPFWVAGTLIALLYLSNAWLIDRHLAWRTKGNEMFSAWLRALRFGLAGLPVFGIWVIPLWAEVVARSPAWAVRRDQGVSSVRAKKRGSQRWFLFRRSGLARNWFESVWGFSFWILTNFAVLWVLGINLQPVLAYRVERTVLIVLAMTLHLAALAGMIHSINAQLQESRLSGLPSAVFRRSLAFFWLPPVPLLALAGLLLFLLSEYLGSINASKSVLTKSTYDSRSDLGRLPLWLGMQKQLQTNWRKSTWLRRLRGSEYSPKLRQGLNAVDLRVLWVYRVRTLFLFLEAAFFTNLLLRSGVDIADSIAVLLLVLPMLLGTLGTLWMAARFFDRLVESDRLSFCDFHPYPSHLAGTQFGFAAGALVGQGLADDNFALVGNAIAFTGLVGALVHFLPIFLNLLIHVPSASHRNDETRVAWMLAFVGVMAVGLGLQQGEPVSQANQTLFKTLVAVSPLTSVLLGMVSLRWLIRPFRFRRVFSRQAEPQQRWFLAFVTVTAVLPLGGLFIPIWICFRHRRCPTDTREWLKSGIS